MPERQPNFADLLHGNEKFGYGQSDTSADDLPGLKEYHESLRFALSKDLIDADTQLHGFDPDVRTIEEFGDAQMLAHSVKNAIDRVLILAEIGANVSREIRDLEASAKPGEAS